MPCQCPHLCLSSSCCLGIPTGGPASRGDSSSAGVASPPSCLGISPFSLKSVTICSVAQAGNGLTLDSSLSSATTLMGQQSTEPTPQELSSSPLVLTPTIATAQATVISCTECSESLRQAPIHVCSQRGPPGTLLSPAKTFRTTLTSAAQVKPTLSSLVFSILKTHLLFPVTSFPRHLGASWPRGC